MALMADDLLARARAYAFEQGLSDSLVQGMLSGEVAIAWAINQNGGSNE